MQLRDYQQRILTDLYDWFERNPNGNPIINAAVGSGKSVMIAELCRRAISEWPETRIVMVVASRELCQQNLQKLFAVWPDAPAGVLSASLGGRDTQSQILFATIGTIICSCHHIGHVDLLLVDECHNINTADTGMYRKLISSLKKYGSPHLRVIGWTGTPFRGNGIWLHQGEDPLFTAIAANIGMATLLKQGHLSPLVLENTDTHIDTKGVGTRNGDYIVSELESRANAVTQSAVDEIIKRGSQRKKWLMFCVTIDHANSVLAALIQKGIDAELITGKTPTKQRANTIERFKQGYLHCLVNVACLTTGFDAPETDLIALLRPTKSPVLYVQIAGRGMRTAPNKENCLWLDFTNTTVELGAVDTLKGRNKRPPQEDEDKSDGPPVKHCEECGNAVPIKALECPDCGFLFPVPIADTSLAKVSTATILASLAAPQTTPVTRVTYRRHIKQGGTDSLRVDYWHGYLVVATEWVCLEHNGFARQKAVTWWQRRSQQPVPLTITAALERTDDLMTPSQIHLIQNGKYQEIKGYEFSRTATTETIIDDCDGDNESAAFSFA